MGIKSGNVNYGNLVMKLCSAGGRDYREKTEAQELDVTSCLMLSIKFCS